MNFDFLQLDSLFNSYLMWFLQIKTKHIFNIVKILTNFWQNQLGTLNLDSLIMIYKNWHKNACSRCQSWVENNVEGSFVEEAICLMLMKMKLFKLTILKNWKINDCL